ncbi:quinone oxidoreductase [Pilimelia terevasa]|uniref:Quinone oxidoreductase n=1 Tax=Pilimelia terevasa TaxID=53372 RepID=A0A8J3FFS6_9ACTN|nr:quinone oxidoreductase [Pilimelia terevasa]GGK22157.1 quinone oxidoreductase [Pilimelia terevasa]
MRAIVVRETGGPEVLRPATVPDPTPPAGHLLVAVEAAGVNFVDVYRRSGAYPGPLPYVPGQEAAGTVVARGAGVSAGPAVGDRVAWANEPGTYADLAVVPADRAVPLPAAVSCAGAAAVLLQGMTAHYLTHDTYPVRPGDTVLVHAAAGGTGMLVTQWVNRRGGRVVGTVSSAAKAAVAEAAGAAHVLRVDRDDIAAAVRAYTGGVGVAAVYDGVGAPTFDASLDSLRPRGTLALFGQAGGRVPPVDLQRLNAAGSVYVTRPNLDHHIATPGELVRRATEVLDAVAAGHLVAHIGGSFPLERAAAAHRALESRASTGKLLLTTDHPASVQTNGEHP